MILPYPNRESYLEKLDVAQRHEDRKEKDTERDRIRAVF